MGRYGAHEGKGQMHLPKRDIGATGLTAAAGLLYVLWAVGAAPPGLSGIRATGATILVFGFAASASAVVPAFYQLIHGNKMYLAATSLVGLLALGAGVLALLDASELGLGLLIGAMGVLWLIATIHHALLGKVTPMSTATPPEYRARAA
jgi:hypothetical protein